MAPEDFRVKRGEELLAADYFSFLATEGIEALPLLHARAVPGGPLARATYEGFKAEFLERVKAALPLDGLYLAMHGAMNVEGMDDAEGDWITAACALAGPDCVVATSYDARPGILDANLMIGYVWADEPRATACAVVTASDKAAARQVAEEIARSYWEAREDFHFGPVTGSLSEMLDIAETTETRPIILADSGDNPTGGGVGDRADVLAALIDRGFSDVIMAGITDRPAVEACFAAGEGEETTLSIGGTLDPASRPVTVPAKVVRLQPGATPADNQAVIAIGGITLVLAARRRPYHDIADFTLLGLDPKAARLVVVKSGYLSPELAPIANPNLMALSNGVVNQDIPALSSHRRQRPAFPFDRDFDYSLRVAFSARWVE